MGTKIGKRLQKETERAVGKLVIKAGKKMIKNEIKKIKKK